MAYDPNANLPDFNITPTFPAGWEGGMADPSAWGPQIPGSDIGTPGWTPPAVIGGPGIGGDITPERIQLVDPSTGIAFEDPELGSSLFRYSYGITPEAYLEITSGSNPSGGGSFDQVGNSEKYRKWELMHFIPGKSPETLYRYFANSSPQAQQDALAAVNYLALQRASNQGEGKPAGYNSFYEYLWENMGNDPAPALSEAELERANNYLKNLDLGGQPDIPGSAAAGQNDPVPAISDPVGGLPVELVNGPKGAASPYEAYQQAYKDPDYTAGELAAKTGINLAAMFLPGGLMRSAYGLGADLANLFGAGVPTSIGDSMVRGGAARRMVIDDVTADQLAPVTLDPVDQIQFNTPGISDGAVSEMARMDATDQVDKALGENLKKMTVDPKMGMGIDTLYRPDPSARRRDALIANVQKGAMAGLEKAKETATTNMQRQRLDEYINVYQKKSPHSAFSLADQYNPVLPGDTAPGISLPGMKLSDVMNLTVPGYSGPQLMGPGIGGM